MNRTSNSNRNAKASSSSAQNDDCIIIEDPIPVIDLCTDDENEPQTASRVRKARRKRGLESPSLVECVDQQKTVANDSTANCRQPGSSSSMAKRRAMGTQSTKDLTGSMSRRPSVNCPICFESVYHRQAASTICGHLFCYACITAEMRIRKKCPMCKHPLRQQQVHPIYFN